MESKKISLNHHPWGCIAFKDGLKIINAQLQSSQDSNLDLFSATEANEFAEPLRLLRVISFSLSFEGILLNFCVSKHQFL